MSLKFKIGLGILIIWLTGCGQAAPSIEATTQPTAMVEIITASPSETPPPAPTAPPPPAAPSPTPGDAIELPGETSTQAPTLIPCSGVLTSPNQEGPYYSFDSPERASLIEPGMAGTPVLILGRVFDQACTPISGAKVDFWLADAQGVYDNIGYRLRGHVFSDENGYYEIESIEPGIYTGRPPHIHVKVFSPQGQELLTTQMYFPGSEGSGDVQAAPDLLVVYLDPDETGRKQVIFNFVVSY